MNFKFTLAALLVLTAAVPAAAQPSSPQSSAPGQATKPAPAPADRRAEAYFNYSMGHFYEETYEDSGRSDDANQAIEFYRKAYSLDPKSAIIGERLAEMYYKAQRIRDAVLELQEIIKREPENLSARRLLGRIYVRNIGDRAPNPGAKELVSRAVEQFREIFRLDPQDTESATWLARLYRMQGEDDKSREVLRGVLARDPDNATVLRQLTQSLIESGDSAEAMRLLESAVARAPQPELLVALGDAATQARDLPKAESAYRQAAESRPDDARIRGKLARCLLAQDKNQAALEQFQKLSQLEPEESENYLRIAQIYRRLDNLALAEENLLRARERSPGNLEVLYTEAMLYEDQGRYEDAIRVLSSAVSAVKANPARLADSKRTLVVLYQQLGRMYRETENYTAAISTFQELTRFGPDEERTARLLMAETYRDSRDMARAIAESERALELYPNDRGARLSRAVLLGENSETDRAAASAKELLRGDASDREVHIALAQIYERGRRFDEAELSIHRAEKLSRTPGENEVLWLLLSAVYDRQKKYDLAEAQLQRVIELNPRSAQALNHLGYMLAERGIRLEEAVGYIERALREDPNSGAYLDSLGWARFKQNRLEEAEKALRRAVERSGHDPTIREHLGDLYQKTGRPALAAREWERSLAEWNRSTPAERDAERMAEIDRKLSSVKHRLAQKTPGEIAKPQ